MIIHDEAKMGINFSHSVDSLSTEPPVANNGEVSTTLPDKQHVITSKEIKKWKRQAKIQVRGNRPNEIAHREKMIRLRRAQSKRQTRSKNK